MKTLISALAALALFAGGARAQTAATMIPGTDAPFLDTSSGIALPCVGCTISSFAAGTNTPARTYVDSTLTTQNNTVITLDSAGYSPSGIWIGGACYKFVLKSAQSTTLRTQDHICDSGRDLVVTLTALLAGATGAAQIGYEAPGTSTLRTVAAKLAETPSVVDFGADATGTLDSAAAINACIAAGPCFLPVGTYRTSSALHLYRSQATLECATRGTIINYTGANIASPLLIGDGITEVDQVTIRNCTIKGSGANITGAAILNNLGNLTTLDNVTADKAPIGLLVYGSILGLVTNYIYDGIASGVGIKFTGAPGTNTACNAWTVINPTIQNLTGGTGMIFTGDGTGRTTAMKVIGGTVEVMALGIQMAKSFGIDIDGVDMEAFSSHYAIEFGGDGGTVHGGVAAGRFHVIATATNTQIHHLNSAYQVKVEAGAVNTQINAVAFDPGDDTPPGTNWLTDAGTNTQFWDDTLLLGNVPLESWHNNTFLDFIGVGSLGCSNCVNDTGAANALAGTFTCVDCTYTPVLNEGMVVSLYVLHTCATGAGNCKFNFAGTGLINVTSGLNLATGLGTAYAVNGFATLKYSGFNGAWVAIDGH